MRWEFLPLEELFVNPNGMSMGKCVLKLVSELQDNPMINESGIIVLPRHVWVYTGKREGFERGKRNNKFERKRKCNNIS